MGGASIKISAVVGNNIVKAVGVTAVLIHNSHVGSGIGAVHDGEIVVELDHRGSGIGGAVRVAGPEGGDRQAKSH